MRYWVILNQKWISILQLVPDLFRVPRSPGLWHYATTYTLAQTCSSCGSVYICRLYIIMLPHTGGKLAEANRRAHAWRLAQLCISVTLTYVGKTTSNSKIVHKTFWIFRHCRQFEKSRKEAMGSHWLIDWRIWSCSIVNSRQHPQTLMKNIKHDRYFTQGLERLNPHENYIHTRDS
jgi:hypothetical protein